MFEKQVQLKTVIPCIEKEYTERLYKANSSLILKDERKGNVSFLEATEYLTKKNAQTIQVIDEKGTKNMALIKKTFPHITIIAGGAINSLEKAQEYLTAGATYVIMSRHFIAHPEELVTFISKFKDQLIISIDDNNGVIESDTNLSTMDYARLVCQNGAQQVLYVNSAKRLTNNGTILDRFKEIRALFKEKILLYSGGITTLKNVEEVVNAGADGVIVGTALYRDNFLLTDAQKLL